MLTDFWFLELIVFVLKIFNDILVNNCKINLSRKEIAILILFLKTAFVKRSVKLHPAYPKIRKQKTRIKT